MRPDVNMGQFGGRVVRQLNAGARRLAPGACLSAETCLSWPLRNRVALRNSGQVEFFTSPGNFIVEPDPQKVDRMAHARAAQAAKRARLAAETNAEKVI